MPRRWMRSSTTHPCVSRFAEPIPMPCAQHGSSPRRSTVTTDEARELKERWGYAGPAPHSSWVWCAWCGEPWPDTPGYWSHRTGPRRVCRACRRDYVSGHGRPQSDAWHRKNRWAMDGALLRRCGRCHEWKPIVEFHVTRKRGESFSAHAFCAHCMNHPPKRYLARRKRNHRHRRTTT